MIGANNSQGRGVLRGRPRGSCRTGRAQLSPALSQREMLPADPRHFLDPGLLQPRGCEAESPSSPPGGAQTAPGSHPAGAQTLKPRSRGQGWCVPEAAWPSALGNPGLEPEPLPGACSPLRALPTPTRARSPQPRAAPPPPGFAAPSLAPTPPSLRICSPGNLGVRPSPGGEPGGLRGRLHALRSRTTPDTGGN